MSDKKNSQELCDKIAMKLHRAEKCLHDVTMELVPELLKAMPECDRKAWIDANRQMYKGLGIIMCAHADMGDCRDNTFPDISVQSGGT